MQSVYYREQKARVLDIAYGSSSIAVNTTASSLSTTASQVLCRRSRGPRSKAQRRKYRELCRIECPPLNVIVMRERLNAKERQATKSPTAMC